MKNHKKLALSITLWILSSIFGLSQVIYFPYYGKNKVIYENFKWKHYKTEHFDIHYYMDSPWVLKILSAMAESAYLRISQNIKHELSAPVPLIYYKTSTDFEQTNLFQLPEGVLGVAEPVLYRIAIQGDMAPDEIQELIIHELTHIFEYDLLWGSPGGVLYALTQPPGWIMEGFCEYNTQNWSSWSSLIVRDAVLNDRIPELNESGELVSSYPLPRPPDYDFGHAIFDFIEHKYGKSGIHELWQALKTMPRVGRKDPIKKAFNMTTKEFNHEFKKYLRLKHRDFLDRESPEDYSFPIGPVFPQNPYYFSLSHAVSPSGDIVAALALNVKDNDLDIILVSTKDGSVIKNITKGYTIKYERIKYEIDPSMGKDIAWSPDGDRIVFFARSGRKHSLFILSPLTGKTLKKIPIPFDQPASPCFFPDREELLFTAFDNGIYDIFKVNLLTQEFTNLTQDDLFEKAPNISPDGKLIAYTIRIDAYDKLFISPAEDLKQKKQLTFGDENAIAPHFASDSKEIFFSSDKRGAFNIYSINIQSGELKRYTDVRSGNFFPIPLPREPQKIVFSSFNKSSFQIYQSELEGKIEEKIIFSERKQEEQFKRFEPILSFEIDENKIEHYKGLGKLYLASRPPVDTIVSTDGSIYGGSALSFTDLLGDHNFYIMAYQVRSFRSYYFAYINQKKRLQYLASVFQYTLFYYPPYSYYDPYFYNFLTYKDALATRKISGISISSYYPLNKYLRTEASLGFYHYEEDFYNPYLTHSLFVRGRTFTSFWNGNHLLLNFSLIGETTKFKYYGPVSGNTFRITFSQALPLAESFFNNTSLEVDLRHYLHLGADLIFAVRFEGFGSWGKNPYIFYFGGNNQVRSSYYYNIIANQGWYANLELRFPLINSASTLIGQIGPVRGTFFFDVAQAKLKGYPAKFISFEGLDSSGAPLFRESEAIGSYGYGFEFFLLGLPVHLEFAKRLEWPAIKNPFDFNSYGNFETKFWIGFDF